MDDTSRQRVDDEVLALILRQIGKVQYGSVTVVIHDGKIVQLDTNAKDRIN